MAKTLVLYPVADATVRTSVFGAGKNLHLAVGLSGGETYRSYVCFPSPDWAGLQIKRIVSATLEPFNSTSGLGLITSRGGTPRVIVSRLTTSFSEGTSTGLASTSAIRWDNKPAIDTATEVSSGTLSTADAGKSTIGITALVQLWAPASVESGGGKPNYGLGFRAQNNETNAANTTEFVAREAGDRDMRLVIVYEDNTAPLAPEQLSPATDDGGAPGLALFTNLSPRTLAFSATRADPDSGDYITKAEVEIYQDSASDATPGTRILSRVQTFTGTPTRVTVSVDVSTLTVGTAYRARMRTADKQAVWSPWTALADMRFRPDSKPALTNPAAEVGSSRPTFFGSISDPDSGATISAAQIRVFRDDAQGTVSLWMDADDYTDVAGGTRFSVPWAGSGDLAFGTRYRVEMRLKDQYGAASDPVTIYITPVDTVGPTNLIPRSVETKQNSLSPSLIVGHSVTFDAYELEVASFAPPEGPPTLPLLWDKAVTTVPSTLSIAVTYGATLPATPLSWGGTYYWRAKVRVGGTTWTEWSAWYPFYLNAAPVSPILSVAGGMETEDGPFGDHWTVPTTQPVFSAPFADPDRTKGYTEVATRQEFELTRLDTGGSPVSFVIASGILDTWTPPSGAMVAEGTYAVRARYDDSANVRSGWSNTLNVKPSIGPTGAGVPASTDPADPTPIIDWTFTGSGGKTQATYRVLIRRSSDGVIVHDSGIVESTDTQYTVPGGVLDDATTYTAPVEFCDTDGLCHVIDDASSATPPGITVFGAASLTATATVSATGTAVTPAPSTGYAAVIAATPNVESHWRLGEASGAFVDVISAHNGTANGTVLRQEDGPVADDTAGGVEFPSGNDYIEVAHDADFDVGGGQAFSIEAWVRRDIDTGWFQCIAQHGIGSWALVIDNADRYALGKMGTAVFVRSTVGAPADGSWHYVLATFGGGIGTGRASIYVDGIDQTEETDTSASFDAVTAPVVLGRETVEEPLRGALDEVAFYRRRLTASEAQAHFDAAGTSGSGTPPPGGGGTGTWFGLSDPWAGQPAFGSRPAAPVQSYRNFGGGGGDKGGAIILDNVRFTNYPMADVIHLEGYRNFIMEDLDFDNVPKCIILYDCEDFTIRRIRVRNVYGPAWPRVPAQWANVIKMVNCKRYLIQDVKVAQPAVKPGGLPYDNSPGANAYGTEDIIYNGTHNGKVSGGDSWTTPAIIERIMIDGGAWESPSGTGLFSGDGDLVGGRGQYIWWRDITLRQPGQVGIGTGEQGPYRFERIKIWSPAITKPFHTSSRTVQGIQLRTNNAILKDLQVDWTNHAGQKSTGTGLSLQSAATGQHQDLGGNNFAATIDPSTLTVIL